MTDAQVIYITTSLTAAAAGVVCCVVGYRKRKNRFFLALVFVWLVLAVSEVVLARSFGEITSTETARDGDAVVITAYTPLDGIPVFSFVWLGLSALLLWKEKAACKAL
jgi:hypothetical protein